MTILSRNDANQLSTAAADEISQRPAVPPLTRHLNRIDKIIREAIRFGRFTVDYHLRQDIPVPMKNSIISELEDLGYVVTYRRKVNIIVINWE